MPVLATGIGSMPGEEQRDLDEAVRVVLGELAAAPGLLFVPEVPGRGATAGMTGRALALVGELDADLQPAGWRLTGSSGAPGLDQRRARSLLAQDLDTLEEQAQGYAGTVKTQVCGPWTLAATVERPRGDRLLADHGARRDLAQALAQGVVEHVADLRRRLPAAERVVVQLDEPALPAVLAGAVPTASGFHRHRTVEPPVAGEALGWVCDAVRGAGAEPWAHCCADVGDGAVLRLLRGAGAAGLAVDLDRVGAGGHDVLAEALEAGDTVVLGVVPAHGADPDAGPTTERVLRWLDVVGLDSAALPGTLGVSPACGLAGTDAASARRALTAAVAAARRLDAG